MFTSTISNLYLTNVREISDDDDISFVHSFLSEYVSKEVSIHSLDRSRYSYEKVFIRTNQVKVRTFLYKTIGNRILRSSQSPWHVRLRLQPWNDKCFLFAYCQPIECYNGPSTGNRRRSEGF